MFCAWKYGKNNNLRSRIFSKIADIFSTASLPKTSPNIKFCSIKIAHRATYIQWLCHHPVRGQKWASARAKFLNDTTFFSFSYLASRNVNHFCPFSGGHEIFLTLFHLRSSCLHIFLKLQWRWWPSKAATWQALYLSDITYYLV